MSEGYSPIATYKVPVNKTGNRAWIIITKDKVITCTCGNTIIAFAAIQGVTACVSYQLVIIISA